MKDVTTRNYATVSDYLADTIQPTESAAQRVARTQVQLAEVNVGDVLADVGNFPREVAHKLRYADRVRLTFDDGSRFDGFYWTAALRFQWERDA